MVRSPRPHFSGSAARLEPLRRLFATRSVVAAGGPWPRHGRGVGRWGGGHVVPQNRACPFSTAKGIPEEKNVIFAASKCSAYAHTLSIEELGEGLSTVAPVLEQTCEEETLDNVAYQRMQGSVL